MHFVILVFEVLKMFFVGGVFSLISTLVLYQFVSFSDDLEMYGIMTTGDAFLIGLVEEIGKAIIVVLFINYQRTNKILNGILIGASIGAGFAVFETAGYILNLSFMSDQTVDLNVMIEIIILRGWSALGGHLVWAAIIGAAVVIVKILVSLLGLISLINDFYFSSLSLLFYILFGMHQSHS